jgi:hypothetical protein
LSTIYSELIAVVCVDFLPQAEGEPDGHYLRRLVLAVSKCSDEAWEALSTKARNWYNAQAIRVKAHQDPEECPGFVGPIVDAVIDAGWPDRGPEGDIHIVSDSPVESEHTFNPSEAAHVPLAAKDGQFVAPADQDSPHALEYSDGHVKVVHPEEFGPVVPEQGVSVSVFAGWPPNPTNILVDERMPENAVLLMHDDLPGAGPLQSKRTATDAVRAVVMQHQDWNQSQIAAELEAHGQPVSLGTIATVRSMTLATIAVAKRLGKWVEG